jgi:hypothetical protein
MGKNLDKILQKLRRRWLSLGYFDLAFFLFSAQELFVLICVIVVFETFGISGILVIILSLGTAIAFDRVLGKILTKVLRRQTAFFFYLFFQISLFGLISTAGLGLANVPKQTLYGSLGFGLWASIAGSLQSYHALISFQEMYRLGLAFEKLNEIFLRLPSSFRTNRAVAEGYYTALNVIPLLYSSHEYLFTIITVGNVVQNLLHEADETAGIGPPTKAKHLGLNVSFGEVTVSGRTLNFDIDYFWHNIRSKYAHVTALSRYGIEEPSQETVRKSVGLLCAFLKSYPACVESGKLDTKT